MAEAGADLSYCRLSWYTMAGGVLQQAQQRAHDETPPKRLLI